MLSGDPIFVGAVLLAGALLGVAAERLRAKKARQAWRARRNSSGWPSFGAKYKAVSPQLSLVSEPVTRRADAADQLRLVMGAEFAVQPLLNRSEARVFKELDRMVLSCNPGWQVMAQVSLGEILRCKDREAYGCVNSKRVDLLLVDEDCRPRHAIEYQGRGHHQGTAAARDAVKKEALRRAGIGYHEVVAGQTTPSELRRLIVKLVEQPFAAAPALPPQNLSAVQAR